MKTTGVFLLISLFFNTVQGQNKYSQFIKKSSVAWAQDITDTIRFANPNLSLLLRQQLEKEKIKVAFLDPGSSTVSVIRFVKKTDVVNTVAPNRTVETMDADGNVIGTVMESESPLLSSKYFDAETNEKLETAQILYIESGELKSYAPWVSLKYSVTTSWGERLGIANAFSTAFGTCRKFSSRIRKRSALLETYTQVLKMDSTGQQKTIKQLYGQNFAKALWPHLDSKHYDIRLIDSDKPVRLQEINQTLIEQNPIAIPVYDEEGNVSTKGVILQQGQALDLSQITQADVIQNFYYDSRKNRVHSQVKEILFYAIRSNGGVSAVAATPILRILVK